MKHQTTHHLTLIVGVLVGALVLVSGILVGVYLTKQNQDTRNQAWGGGYKRLPTPDWKYGGGSYKRPEPPRTQF